MQEHDHDTLVSDSDQFPTDPLVFPKRAPRRSSSSRMATSSTCGSRRWQSAWVR